MFGSCSLWLSPLILALYVLNDSSTEATLPRRGSILNVQNKVTAAGLVSAGALSAPFRRGAPGGSSRDEGCGLGTWGCGTEAQRGVSWCCGSRVRVRGVLWRRGSHRQPSSRAPLPRPGPHLLSPFPPAAVDGNRCRSASPSPRRCLCCCRQPSAGWSQRRLQRAVG